MIRSLLLAAGLAAGLSASAAAQQPAPDPHAHATRSLQGDQSAWRKDPMWRTYYQLTIEAFAAGPAKVDEAAYQAKSYELFRQFAVTHGVPPEHMVDHLKLIPGQIVKIVREDPEVLKTYDNFLDATFGPP